MPWVKVPLENRPIFQAALPEDPRVETVQMFARADGARWLTAPA